MSTVTGRRESQWKKDDGTETTTYWIALEGQEKDVPCYDERAASLVIDAPLPEGWEIKQSKAGKDYLSPPRPARGGGGFGGGGGAASYRNTKEGAAAERESIHRSVALTQAVLFGRGAFPVNETLETASKFYTWLSQSPASEILPSRAGGGTGVGSQGASDASPTPKSSSPSEARNGGSASKAEGVLGKASSAKTPAATTNTADLWQGMGGV